MLKSRDTVSTEQHYFFTIVTFLQNLFMRFAPGLIPPMRISFGQHSMESECDLMQSVSHSLSLSLSLIDNKQIGFLENDLMAPLRS